MGASQLSEYCLPKTKPQNCPVLSWNQLGRVFTGIGCKPQSSNTNVKVSTKQLIISLSDTKIHTTYMHMVHII